MRSSIVICAAVAAVVTTPASASRATAPRLVATVTAAVAHKPYPRPGALITLSFTIEEPGQAPGSGVPAGSVFDVQLTRKTGSPANLVTAIGDNGRYHATVRWSGGLIRAIKIGGFLNATPSTAQGGFWLPVTVLKRNF